MIYLFNKNNLVYALNFLLEVITVASSTSQIQYPRKIELAESGRYRTARLIVYSHCGIDEEHGFVGRCHQNRIDMKANYDGLLNG